MKLREFVKEKRSVNNLTQQELAEKAGVGLRFVREIGRASCRERV